MQGVCASAFGHIVTVLALELIQSEKGHCLPVARVQLLFVWISFLCDLDL